MVWSGGHTMVYSMSWRAWCDICHGLAGIAWYMVWPGRHGMVWPDGHGMVYMAWPAWHVIWYGLAGMTWYIVWPVGHAGYMEQRA